MDIPNINLTVDSNESTIDRIKQIKRQELFRRYEQYRSLPLPSPAEPVPFDANSLKTHEHDYRHFIDFQNASEHTPADQHLPAEERQKGQYPLIETQEQLASMVWDTYHANKSSLTAEEATALKRIYYFIADSFIDVGGTATFIDWLISSPQSAQDFQFVFAEILAAEEFARADFSEFFSDAQPMIAALERRSLELFPEARFYHQDEYIYVPGETEEGFMAVESGPVEYLINKARSFTGKVTGKGIEPEIPVIIINSLYSERLRELSPELRKLFIAYFHTHESFHLNSKYRSAELATAQIVELMTDAACEELLLEQMPGKPEENTQTLRQSVLGYGRYMVIKDILLTEGLIDKKNLIQLGINQDFELFISRINESLAVASPEIQNRILTFLKETHMLHDEDIPSIPLRIDEIFGFITKFRPDLAVDKQSGPRTYTGRQSLPDTDMVYPALIADSELVLKQAAVASNITAKMKIPPNNKAA